MFVQNLLGGPKIWKLGQVTELPTFNGRFAFNTQAGSVVLPCTKFAADCSVHSQVLKGVTKLGNYTK